MDMELYFPNPIINACKKLSDSGYEAYIVGGAVRDAFLNKKNYDFDITTNAFPEEISKVFPKAKKYGDFGTMLVIEEDYKIEVTPYRNDAPGRKPHYIFGGTIYTDLSRRDFTINSIAYDPLKKQLIDPFNGLEDLKNKIIRCTGSAKRIWEDPLRSIRAARFQSQLGFYIHSNTLYAMKSQSKSITEISKERIRDELSKLLTGEYPMDGLITLIITDLMKYIIPELLEGMGIMHNNKPYDVLEHILLTCQNVKNDLILRLTALLHDIAKPRTMECENGILKFPHHHIKSAELAKEILKNLRFDKKTINTVIHLIENHMFFYYPDYPISEARKLVSKIGWENIYHLIELRIADRKASGFAEPASKGLKKLIEHLEIIKEEKSDYRIKDLRISGKDLIEELDIPEGPIVREVLEFLLEKIMENPQINQKEKLIEIAKNYLKR